jgi:hypothetical protein
MKTMIAHVKSPLAGHGHCYHKFNGGGYFSFSEAGKVNRLQAKVTVNP